MEDGCIQFMHVLLQKRVGSMLFIYWWKMDVNSIRDITVILHMGMWILRVMYRKIALKLVFRYLSFNWTWQIWRTYIWICIWTNLVDLDLIYKAQTLCFDPNILFKIECEILSQNLLLVQMSSIWVVMGMMLCRHLPYVIFFHPAHQYNMK